jgi:hypothetical protein
MKKMIEKRTRDLNEGLDFNDGERIHTIWTFRVLTPVIDSVFHNRKKEENEDHTPLRRQTTYKSRYKIMVI